MAGYCLFVYNLPPQVDDNGLMSLFTSYGSVVAANVARKSITQAKVCSVVVVVVVVVVNKKLLLLL